MSVSSDDFREPCFFEIGYTGDDSFDNNHVDYEVCCGCCHTRRSGKVISVFSFLFALLFLALGAGNSNTEIANSIFSSIYLISTIVLLVGVFTHRAKLLIPFLVVSVAKELWDFYNIATIAIELFEQLNTTDAEIGLTVMLAMILLICTSLFTVFALWTIWIMYVHYCYLRDRPRNTGDIFKETKAQYRFMRNIKAVWKFK
ncbi:hypothetical protein L596_015335 [Steinernema carpocapsae]|uniref:Uncharacterized protein n=1 Tax=Steinernema carpocapsae TaxID=34508 RepID=A0A4U5NFZ4_STECR|nr:hypothetical protein L596_015335 [Steinernema carpocapsae]